MNSTLLEENFNKSLEAGRFKLVLKRDELGRKAKKTIVNMLASDLLKQFPEDVDWEDEITVDIITTDKGLVEYMFRNHVLPGVESITI